VISNHFPLHRYPTHAFKVLTALYPTLEENYITTKLICLSQAHTRFVLLLQALVHSSSSPIPPEQDDFRRTSYRLSAISNLPNSGPLEFPAPLSYLREQATHEDAVFDSTLVSKHLKRHSQGHTDIALTTINNNVPGTRLSRQVSKPKSSRSLFRKARVTLPLPEREPHALRIYSTYRKNSAYNNNRLSRTTSANDFASPASFEFKGPERHFVSSTDSSASSSPVASSSPLPQPRAGERSPIGHSPPSTSSSHSSISTNSPHDLHLATSRVRAPVLRVFVPCTKMEIDSESILLCERQLVEAGVWQHLSIGDIVCNFGYIPPTSDDISTTTTDEDSTTPYRWSPRSRCGNNTRHDPGKWLLFDGDALVPYIASTMLPVENPISLPSPYYYAHLMPNATPIGNVSQFRFMIGKFPPVKHEIPQLAMVNLSSRVRSRKSANGWVEVRRWVWTARFVRYRPTLLMDPAEEIGAGWLGEWVLEGMGTSEGRQMLLDILNYGTVPGGPTEWELVRERSGGGKIWLRFVFLLI
jgi:hypothetical protein